MADGKLSEEQEKALQECYRKFEQLEKQLANLQRVRGVLDAIDDEARIEQSEMKSDPPAQPRPPVDVPAPSVEIRKDSDGGKK